MPNQELNRKLAEWRWGKHYEWYPPEEPYLSDYPNFIESLDACFRWLVPKLQYFFSFAFNETLLKADAFRWCCRMHNKGVGTFIDYGETPALALCLAIEQLIDKEVKDEPSNS